MIIHTIILKDAFEVNMEKNCTEKCSESCVNDTCDINSGTCFLCDIGYKGSHCDLGKLKY